MPRITSRLVDNFSQLTPLARRNIGVGARQIVLQGAQQLEGLTKTWIKRNGPYDRGNLRQSIHARLVSAESPGQIAATVASNADYAESAHQGQKPGHWPPRGVLEAWVRRRVRQGRLQLTGIEPGKRGAPKARDRQVRAIAFLIGRKIKQRGTQGVPFFDRVYDENHGTIERFIERQMVRLIREELTRG